MRSLESSSQHAASLPRNAGQRPHRFLTFLACLLSTLIASTCLAAPPTDSDRWYTITVQGRRAGWMHDQRTTADNRITSRLSMRLELRRGDRAVAVSIDADFVESLDGKPVSLKLTQALSSDPTTEEYAFTATGIDATVTTSDQKRTSTRPLPDGHFLTPAGASSYIEQRLQAGAKEYTLRAIDPVSGPDPILTTSKVVDRVSITALGRAVPTFKVVSTSDRRPSEETTDFLDERGVIIRSQSSFGDLKLEMTITDRATATAPLDPPEMLVSSMVKLDRAIDEPRSLARGVYLLEATEGSIPDLSEGACQTVERLSPSRVRITVIASEDASAPTVTLPADHPYAASTTLIASDNPDVIALARQVTSDPKAPPAAAAEAMRVFVHNYITKKSLSVGFAGAAEVARSREGDCTEHAVLLAALLRASNIPSRVVSGLVYADEFQGASHVFAYHMWTQAFIATDPQSPNVGRWINLDATLAERTPFDATHLALATSALETSTNTSSIASLLPMIGRLRITVESPQPAPAK